MADLMVGHRASAVGRGDSLKLFSKLHAPKKPCKSPERQSERLENLWGLNDSESYDQGGVTQYNQEQKN